MDPIQQFLAGNKGYRDSDFTESLAGQAAPPRRRLAVVCCMDARHVPERVLGLEPGDAVVIRTAGAVVDEGALRSLVAAVHLLDVETIIHMPHSDCGLKGLHEKSDALLARMSRQLGGSLDAKVLQETLHWLQPFQDTLLHARDSMARIRTHALIPNDIRVHGLIYDNKTGAVEPVPEATAATP